MSEKSVTFCWSAVSHCLEVFDQHRKGNTADVNLGRSEHLSVLFTNVNKTRKELRYVLRCSRFREMNKAHYYV